MHIFFYFSGKNQSKNRAKISKKIIFIPFGARWTSCSIHRVRALSTRNSSRFTGMVHDGRRCFHMIRWSTFIPTKIGWLTAFSTVIRTSRCDLTAQIPSIARSNGWECSRFWIEDQRCDPTAQISFEVWLDGQNRIRM